MTSQNKGKGKQNPLFSSFFREYNNPTTNKSMQYPSQKLSHHTRVDRNKDGLSPSCEAILRGKAKRIQLEFLGGSCDLKY